MKNVLARIRESTRGTCITIWPSVHRCRISSSRSCSRRKRHFQPRSARMLVPICAYVVMAISLNLTVGVIGRAVARSRGLHVASAPSSGIDRRPCRCMAVHSVRSAASRHRNGRRRDLRLHRRAFIVGVPVLRLRGDYLAIVTLAFGEIIKNIVTNLVHRPGHTGCIPASLPAGAENLEEGGKLIPRRDRWALAACRRSPRSPAVLSYVMLCLIVIFHLVNRPHGARHSRHPR